jgi:CRISPR-associated endonuclease/helicase Cas3
LCRGRTTLDDLPKQKWQAQVLLAYRTVVLPVTVGGLTESGILDGSQEKTDHLDVAKEDRRDRGLRERGRCRVWLRVIDQEFWERELDTAGNWPDTATEQGRPCKSPRDAAVQIAHARRMKVARLLALRQPTEDTEEAAAEYLVLLVEAPDVEVEDSESASYEEPPTIAIHTRDVVDRVTRIADALSLDDSLKRPLTLAAELHDLGKGRDVWQHAIYNSPVVGEPLAKPKAEGLDWRRLGGYRHEFGSLLDALQHPEVKKLPELERDLVLHSIATHHGHGRPHFEPETYDFERNTAEQNENAAREVLRRFGQLQLRYGRWKLAWLESLLRCADAAASAEPSSRQTASSERTQ